MQFYRLKNKIKYEYKLEDIIQSSKSLKEYKNVLKKKKVDII